MHPNLGHLEPILEEFPQNFRCLVDVPNYKIIYWIEENTVKIATVFDCRQKPQTIYHIINNRTDWVCEPQVSYKTNITMTYAELQARKAQLIEYIKEEVYNEEILSRFESVVSELEGGFSSNHFPEDYPFAPSAEELKKKINQVLEDDRNGLFLDGEQCFRELMAKADEYIRIEKKAKSV